MTPVISSQVASTPSGDQSDFVDVSNEPHIQVELAARRALMQQVCTLQETVKKLESSLKEKEVRVELQDAAIKVLTSIVSEQTAKLKQQDARISEFVEATTQSPHTPPIVTYSFQNEQIKHQLWINGWVEKARKEGFEIEYRLTSGNGNGAFFIVGTQDRYRDSLDKKLSSK